MKRLEIRAVAARADDRYGKLEDLLASGTGTISTPEQWEERSESFRRELQDILGKFPKEQCELKPRVLREVPCEGYVRKKVRYLAEPGEDVTAFLLVPETATTTAPAPAILAMHQTAEPAKDELCGLSGRPAMHYGLDLVRRGYVVLVPDSITAGERIYAGYEPFETAGFDQENPEWSAMGKMLWDHQRGLDYLETLPFVDASRIGAVGHSLGAYNAFFLSALDPRVKAVIESCGYATIASDEGRERWARTSWFVHIPRLRSYVEPGSTLKPPIEFHQILALTAPRPLYQIAGLEDQYFPSCDSVAQVHLQLEKVYQLHGTPDRLETYLFPGKHEFIPEAKHEAYEFLDRHLKAKNATGELKPGGR